MRQLSILTLALGVMLVFVQATVWDVHEDRLVDAYANIIAEEFSLELDSVPPGAPTDYPTVRQKLAGFLRVFVAKRTADEDVLYACCALLAGSAILALYRPSKRKATKVQQVAAAHPSSSESSA